MSMKRIGALTVWLLLGVLAACVPVAPTTVAPTRGPATPTQAPTQPSPLPGTPTPTSAPPPAPTADLSWILEAGPADVEYRIPLVLRHASDTAAWLQYELRDSERAELVVWRVDRSAAPVRTELQGASGVVRAAGLQPATRYAASIVVGDSAQEVRRPTLDGEVWSPVEFTTQSGSAAFQVGVIGDSGFDDQVTRGLVSEMARHDLGLTLHTGDLVYRVHENPDPPTAFIEKLYEPLAPLLQRGPFYPVPGNHEYDAPARWDGEPYYKHAFPALAADGVAAGEGSWYAFEYGGVQFVMLDSQVWFGVAGSSAQEAWLEERLADEGHRYTVVVLHVPPYSVGRHRTDARVVQAQWADKFEAAGVPLVLAGHDHNYQRFLVGDTTYLVTGGGSAVTYPVQGSDPRLRASSSRPHFVLLSFELERIVVEAIDAQGISLDRAEIPIPESTP